MFGRKKTHHKHIHDVLNIFMLSGFTRNEGKYFVKPSPATKGRKKLFEFVNNK